MESSRCAVAAADSRPWLAARPDLPTPDYRDEAQRGCCYRLQRLHQRRSLEAVTVNCQTLHVRLQHPASFACGSTTTQSPRVLRWPYHSGYYRSHHNRTRYGIHNNQVSHPQTRHYKARSPPHFGEITRPLVHRDLAGLFPPRCASHWPHTRDQAWQGPLFLAGEQAASLSRYQRSVSPPLPCISHTPRTVWATVRA